MTTATRRGIRVIDSHTGGEPTRVVIDSLADLRGLSVADQLVRLRDRHDDLRRICIHEPRGGEVWVGALICEPSDPTCDVGVIFFNNIGYLGMCGHGTIGLVVTLAHLGRFGRETTACVRIETPVGPVQAVWHGGGEVSVTNVSSHRVAKDVVVDVAGLGKVRGDVAWSGNGFFLAKDIGESIVSGNVDRLIDVAGRIRQAVNAAGFGEVDHVELFGPPSVLGADSRNFVLCPGGAFDRSPCGTGTSAKLACLHALGELAPGEPWRQQSITGSVFEGSYRALGDGRVAPTITGRAWVNAEATLLLDPDDPCCWGIAAR
jgi:proline racemase